MTPHLLGPCGTPIPVEKLLPNLLTNRTHFHTAKKKKKSSKVPKKLAKMVKESWSRLIFSIAILSLLSAVFSIDDKCAACTAIAEELERGLMNERPRNHLDMRHRLDSQGQRQGKVIDYRVSELRVVDLLDGLCEKMQDYTLEKVDSSTQVWIKVDNWDVLKTNKQEARAHSKAISSFCGRLLEETEDDLSELIKKGYVKAGGVSKVLCEDLSRYCDQPRADKDDDKVMDEL